MNAGFQSGAVKKVKVEADDPLRPCLVYYMVSHLPHSIGQSGGKIESIQWEE